MSAISLRTILVRTSNAGVLTEPLPRFRLATTGFQPRLLIHPLDAGLAVCTPGDSCCAVDVCTLDSKIPVSASVREKERWVGCYVHETSDIIIHNPTAGLRT